MKIVKIKYNNGANEGYFVRTIRGLVSVSIKEGECVELRNIIAEKEIRINDANLKVEEVIGDGSYFG